MNNFMDATSTYIAARELHKLDKSNFNIRKSINSIDIDFFFDTLDSLFEVIDRQANELQELINKLKEESDEKDIS